MSDVSHPQHGPHNEGSHYQPSLAVVLLILVLFVGATFVMLRNSGAAPVNGTTTTTTAGAGASGSTSTTTSLVPKAKVRVQVANGTTITGLARANTQQLMTFGWDTLPEVNGPSTAKTIVYFNPGYQWAARQIATELKLNTSAVQPLNGLHSVAGASSDDVIVLLGPDSAVKG
ncbi:MAG: LytR C-terminal domain-containing protein [Acidobacteria bacterium]|nr:LytR C-terminal domain-containing protein [Acidobacteriota bacterium]